MGFWLTAASAATALNVLLLVALVGIWVRNYSEFRTKHTLGFAIFGVMLLAENGLAFYYYVLDPTVATALNNAAPFAGRAMMSVQMLELLALLFLTWVTWD